MLERGIKLVGDSVAGAARPISLRIAALDHETVDNAMEDQPVIEPLFREVDKILRGNGGFVLEKFHLERALVRRKFCNAVVCHCFLLSFVLIQQHIE